MTEDALARACTALWARLSRTVSVGPGLTDAEIDRASAAVGATLPAQLTFFLRSGYPMTGGSWHPWREDPDGVVERGRARLRETLTFDVARNDYWLDEWGPRPADLDAAADRAWAVVRTWPPLVPLYAHRCVVADNTEQASVLSVWQFVDSIWYGTDLVDWIDREFGVTVPGYQAPPTRELAGWSAAFDL